MTADGFYEKNVGSVSFFMRVVSTGGNFPMTFHSILIERTEDRKKETVEAPVFFDDLNLDQIIDAIVVGRQEYNLKP
ncbi:MAG TPA: hypothetical protein DHW02_18475, partial [Ktedonobacter sp.]|nr:hypothetical protein [Ktedonobacter sp.]